MKISQVRFLLSLAGSLAIIGCTQSQTTKSSLGQLPGQDPLPTDQPRVNSATFCAHGHLLERQGQLERAIVQYRKALALTPDFLTARNRLGITLNKLGRHEEASAEFRQALLNHPTEAYLHNNLGFSLYLEEKYLEAIESIKTALELDPQFSRAHMNYALVLAKMEMYDQAFEELSQAGSTTDAYFNMGVILTEAKKFAEASQYLEAALAANPSFDAARQQLLLVSRLAAEYEAQQALDEVLAAQDTTTTESNDDTDAGADTVAGSSTDEDDETVDVAATTPRRTPAHTAKPVATAPRRQAALWIEDVPLNLPLRQSKVQSEDPFSQTIAQAEPAEANTPALGDSSTLASSDSTKGDALAAEDQPETTTDSTSSAVTSEDVAANQPISNPPDNQDTTFSAAPTPPVFEESEQAWAQETHSEPQPISAPQPRTSSSSAVVVETIALTPGAAGIKSSPTESNLGTGQDLPEIDQEKLSMLISDALYALQHNPAEFNRLWCEVTDYVNNEIAPNLQKAIGK